jgi:SRSO17 transposase
MVPVCRTEGKGWAMPTLDGVLSDVEGFKEALWEFQVAFHDWFARSEPRAHFFDSMVGQLRPLARTSIEPMARQVAGGTIRGMQRLLSAVAWDEAQMRWNSHHLVAEALGDPAGVLLFDETGFRKKGQDSVGVARQYCRSLGKVEHCQVGVFAGYVSRYGAALVDKRLLLPEVWWTETYAARRTRCHVPAALTFQSQPQLAAAMLAAIAHQGAPPVQVYRGRGPLWQ